MDDLVILDEVAKADKIKKMLSLFFDFIEISPNLKMGEFSNLHVQDYQKKKKKRGLQHSLLRGSFLFASQGVDTTTLHF